MRWTTRQIEAPDRDTLSASEVAGYLGYSDPKSVRRLVEEGRFPEANEDGKWFWEDVVWYQFNKRVRGRLKKATADEHPTPLPADKGSPKKG